MAEREGRPKGRRTKTQRGTSDPSGAAVPAPQVRRRAGAAADAEGADTSPGRKTEPAVPAEVVHLIPAEHLEAVDTTGMSLPVGAGSAASDVRLPGDTVLTRPDESDIPTPEELDEREARKAGRRKRTGPKPPEGARTSERAPAETAPPPTDPEPVDPDPGPTDPTDPS